MRLLLLLALFAALLASAGTSLAQGSPVRVTVHSARSGPWSDPTTWQEKRLPATGDVVQVRAGHAVTYDVLSPQQIRMIHVAGKLAFSREKSTRLEVGLLKVQAGDTAAEDGFECEAHADASGADPNRPAPTLEIGTVDAPIPPGVTATIRLAYFDGMDKTTLPAIVDCGGQWEVHGAPMSRTWVKLGASCKPGDASVTLSEPVTGWKAGDRVIVTAAKEHYSAVGFRPSRGGHGETEERFITRIDGTSLVLDRPLQYEHWGVGETRSEIANLSRNVVIESADPDGVRGHTMYHRASTGGVSYAEFRHLGKENVLGRYSLHFHLV